MINEPKKPVQGNWIYVGQQSYGHVWDSLDGRRVVSSVDMIHDKPEWHLSISKNFNRPSTECVKETLKDFGAEGFDEDNHLSGKARHFWLACTVTLQKPCDCKENEKPIREGDFEWRPEDKEA